MTVKRSIMHRSLALEASQFGRVGPYLLALTVCTVFALQPNLYPSRVLPIEIPPPGGDMAAPENSAAPEIAPPAPPVISELPPTVALPSESVPAELVPPAADASTAPIALGPLASLAGGSGAAAAMPGAAGATAVPARRPGMSATHIATAIPLPAHRSAPAARTATHSPAAIRPVAPMKNPAAGHEAPRAAAPVLSGLASGNRAPKLGVLGGPGPFTSRVAARIDGTAMRQRF